MDKQAETHQKKCYGGVAIGKKRSSHEKVLFLFFDDVGLHGCVPAG
jgi:hypothetical protein